MKRRRPTQHRRRLRSGKVITINKGRKKKVKRKRIVRSTKKADFNEDVNEISFKSDDGELRLFKYPDKDQVGVVSLYVNEDKRRKGVASSLLNEAKKEFKEISSQVSNIPSVKLHHKLGFRLDNDKENTEEDAISKYNNNTYGSVNLKFKDNRVRRKRNVLDNQLKYVTGIIKNKRKNNIRLSNLAKLKYDQHDIKRDIAKNTQDIDMLNKKYFPDNPR